MKKNIRILLLTLLTAWILGISLIAWRGCSDVVGPCDLALVLGNKVNPDGTPAPRLKARLEKTVALYREGVFPVILVSGGLGSEGHDEAAVMANYLVDQGIPRAAIFEDNEGNNTFASAKKTAALCAERKIRRVMVISQYFHIPRAELALKKFGVPHVLHAHANYVEWARDPYSLSRELAGFITYYFKSYPPIVLGAAFTWGGPRS